MATDSPLCCKSGRIKHVWIKHVHLALFRRHISSVPSMRALLNTMVRQQYYSCTTAVGGWRKNRLRQTNGHGVGTFRLTNTLRMIGHCCCSGHGSVIQPESAIKNERYHMTTDAFERSGRPLSETSNGLRVPRPPVHKIWAMCVSRVWISVYANNIDNNTALPIGNHFKTWGKQGSCFPS